MAGHIPRIHCEQAPGTGQTLKLGEKPSHHLLRVLRLGVGDAVVVFDGAGGEYLSEIAVCGKNRVEILVGAHQSVQRESSLSITLAQGISRNERMDYTIQKAVELGVAEILPLQTERSSVRLDAERQVRKHEHWQAVARSAAEQCGRDRVPAVTEIRQIDEWLAEEKGGSRLMLDPQATTSLRGLKSSSDITLLIGPEGGLSDAELLLARKRGFTGVRLGPRILRTETAGVAALAAIQTLWGDLAG
jgi:16S rRNA (uracil1498-N3)-methyltransferase